MGMSFLAAIGLSCLILLLINMTNAYTLCGVYDLRGKFSDAHFPQREGMQFYRDHMNKAGNFIVNNLPQTLTLKTIDGGTSCAADNNTLLRDYMLDSYQELIDSQECSAFFVPNLYSYTSSIINLTNTYNYMTFTNTLGDLAYTKPSTISIGSDVKFTEKLAIFRAGIVKKEKPKISVLQTLSNTTANFGLFDYLTLIQEGFKVQTADNYYMKLDENGNVDETLLRQALSHFQKSDMLIVYRANEAEIKVLGKLMNEALLNTDALIIFDHRHDEHQHGDHDDHDDHDDSEESHEEVQTEFPYFYYIGRWPTSMSYGSDSRYMGNTQNFNTLFEAALTHAPSEYNVNGAEVATLFHYFTEKGSCEPPDSSNATSRLAFKDCMTNSLATNKNGSIYSMDFDFETTTGVGHMNSAFNVELRQTTGDRTSTSDISAFTHPSPFPEVQIQQLSIWALCVVYIITSLLFIFFVLIATYIFIHRHDPVVRSSAFLYLQGMLGGLFISFLSLLLLWPIRTDIWCNVSAAVDQLGFFVTWTFLIVKTYRLSQALQFRQDITKESTIRKVMCLWMVLFVICLVLSSVFNSSEMEYVFLDPLLKYATCTVNTWQYVFYAIKILFIVLAFFMSYQVRRAPTSFNESRYLVLISIIALFLVICEISLTAFFDFPNQNANYDFIVAAFFTITNIANVLALFFGPKIYAVYYKRTSNRSENESKSKSGSSFSFDIPDAKVPNNIKTEKLKPWVEEKWDCSMSATDQRVRISQMVAQFNNVLYHAHVLSQVSRAQRVMLNNAGVTGNDQNNFIVQFTSIPANKGASHSNLLGSTSRDTMTSKASKEAIIDCDTESEI